MEGKARCSHSGRGRGGSENCGLRVQRVWLRMVLENRAETTPQPRHGVTAQQWYAMGRYPLLCAHNGTIGWLRSGHQTALTEGCTGGQDERGEDGSPGPQGSQGMVQRGVWWWSTSPLRRVPSHSCRLLSLRQWPAADCLVGWELPQERKTPGGMNALTLQLGPLPGPESSRQYAARCGGQVEVWCGH